MCEEYIVLKQLGILEEYKLMYFKLCKLTGATPCILGMVLLLANYSQLRFTMPDAFYFQFLENEDKELKDEYIVFKRNSLARECNYTDWRKRYL